MNEVQKPISVILNEKKDELVELINKDLRELHPSLLEPIVKDIYLAVAEQKKKVEKAELDKYNEDLLKECESENETEPVTLQTSPAEVVEDAHLE